MQFSLEAPDGTVIDSYLKDHKEFIRIAGLKYDGAKSILTDQERAFQ